MIQYKIKNVIDELREGQYVVINLKEGFLAIAECAYVHDLYNQCMWT